MIVGDVMRLFFQGLENKFKAGVVTPGDSNASEVFEKGGEKSGRFRRGFLFQGLKRGAAQILGNLVGPKRFDDWRELVQACADDAPHGALGVVDTPRVI